MKILNIKDPSTVWMELNSMRKNNLMCDMQFTCADQITLSAHSCIVGASSEFLRSALTSTKTFRSSKMVIELRAVSHHVIDCILNLLYTGTSSIDDKYLKSLQATANSLCIKCLLETSLNIVDVQENNSFKKIPTNQGTLLEIEGIQSGEEYKAPSYEEVRNVSHDTSTNIDMTNNCDESENSTSQDNQCNNDIIEEQGVEHNQHFAENNHNNKTETQLELLTNENQQEEKMAVNENIEQKMFQSKKELLSTNLTENNQSHSIATASKQEQQSFVSVVCKNNQQLLLNIPTSLSNVQDSTSIAENSSASLQERQIVEYNIQDTVEKAETSILSSTSTVQSVNECSGLTTQASQIESSVLYSSNLDVDGIECYSSEVPTVQIQIDCPTEMGNSDKSVAILTLPTKDENHKDLEDAISKQEMEIDTATEEENIAIDIIPEGESSIYCQLCFITFTNLAELQNHLGTVHHEILSDKHLLVQQEGNEETVGSDNTAVLGSDIRYDCKLCAHRFKNKHNLKLHMARHLKEKPFICITADCNKSFSTKADLMTHFRSHTGAKPYACEFCQKAFSQSSNLMTHKRSVHNEEFMGGARNYECEACEKKFKTKDMLSKHLKRHSQCFTCAHCEATFKTRKEMQKHVKDVHNVDGFALAKEDGGNVTLYQCPHCSKHYMDLPRLTQHMEIVHKKAKRYRCSMEGCDYKAYFKYAVERHYLKLHVQSGSKKVQEQEFLCKHCHTMFIGYRGLGIHMRRQHGHVGAFSYEDAVESSTSVSYVKDDEESGNEKAENDGETMQGNRQARSKSNTYIQKYHQQSSTFCSGKNKKYTCEICHAILSSESALKSHSSLHNAEAKLETYKCSLCSKSFSQKAHLKRHIILQHSKSTRFQCVEPDCDYQCYYASQMKEHFKFRHKKNEIPEKSLISRCRRNSAE